MCPGVQFVIVSPDAPPEAAPRETNVAYLPGGLYEDVPAFYQHAAVGIIPFALSRLTAPVNPIKMYECLAAGTPVVASNWGELRRLDAPVSLAETPEDFARCIRDAVADDSRDDDRDDRRADGRDDGLADGVEADEAIGKFLARHSWDGNLDELLRRIDQVRARRAVEA